VGDWRKTVKSGASNHALIRLGGLWPQLLWEALGTVRALGALVRLITPVYAGKEEEAADRRRLAFTKETVPVLNEFLPK
jgi:hypothetical protein